MYAFHDAFRRDLLRLIAVADAGRAGRTAARSGWETLKKQLQVHHSVPWMLDEASATTTAEVLGPLLPPARVLYRMIWRRSYARTPRWADTAA
jgi:hypothetical protein